MAAFISERLIIQSDKDVSDVEFYLNDKAEIFVNQVTEDVGGMFFTFNQDDWKLIKKFIDNQFKNG